MKKKKIRDGFEGQKQINLPHSIFSSKGIGSAILNQIFITHIGYFPNAKHHFRERRKGCEDNIFIYCLSGKGWYQIGEKRYEVVANEFFQIPATTQNLKYGADDEYPWSIFWVHYSGNDMESFNRVMNIFISDGPKNIPFNEKGLTIWEEMYKLLEMGFSKDNLNHANMCLYHFLSTFLYPDRNFFVSDDKDIVKETIVFMRDCINAKLAVKDFASRYQFSISHFSRLFRKSTGMAPMDYFIHLKIQQSSQLLLNSKLKVKDVAIEIGYDDQYYFSRIFKKIMGVSPEHYRMINQGF